MELSVITNFPEKSIADVPRMLRALAEEIEEGKFGDAHNLAYSIDCGDHRVEVGLCGTSPEGGVTAYYLFGLAMRKLEGL
jgi:hypothetical protein